MESNSIETRFNKIFDIYSNNIDRFTIKELCRTFYNQGVYDNDNGEVQLQYVSDDAVMDLVSNTNFIDDVRYWLEHPDSGTIQASQDGYVRVSVPCHDPSHLKCIAWPDRCEDCGGDGVTCSELVNLYKLCNVEPPKIKPAAEKDYNNILTPDEVQMLTNILVKLNK